MNFGIFHGELGTAMPGTLKILKTPREPSRNIGSCLMLLSHPVFRPGRSALPPEIQNSHGQNIQVNSMTPSITDLESLWGKDYSMAFTRGTTPIIHSEFEYETLLWRLRSSARDF